MKKSWTLVFLLALCGVTAVGWIYSRNALFRLAEIHVATEDPELVSAIQQRLISYLGRSLFSLSLENVEQDVLKISRVEQVTLRRQWPSALWVIPQLREAVAMEFEKKELWSVDDGGHLIEVLRRPEGFPLIRSRPGDFSTQRELFGWLKKVENEEEGTLLAFRKMDEVFWSADKGLTLRSYELELEVELGYQNFEKAWERAQQAYEVLREKGIRANFLGATYHHRVVASRLQNFQTGLNLKELVRRAEPHPTTLPSSGGGASRAR